MPERNAMGVHETRTSNDPWSAVTTVKRIKDDATPDTLRRVFAWVDPKSDPSIRDAYRFAHHHVDVNGAPDAANMIACREGIDDLNGPSDGAGIPSEDRSDVYTHLAAHLRAAGQDPPPLRPSFEDDVVIREATELMGAGVNVSLVERRYTPGGVEMRQTDGLHRIGGYAAVYEKVSRNLGGFVEVVTRSVFTKTRLDGWPGVLCRYNHDDNMLLGTSDAGTLTLRSDDIGLEYLVTPPKSRSDIMELVERGDVRKSSFAFRVIQDEWTTTEQGYPLRNLVEAQLVDVAPVNSPAYTESTAGLRSLAEKVGADIEEIRKAASVDDLRKFLVSTGAAPARAQKKHGLFGPQARLLLDQLKESAE